MTTPSLLLALLSVLLLTGCGQKAPVTFVYEDITYSFVDESARAKFQADREKSLYHRLGGKAAVEAAVDKFYVKVLADKRINHFFEDINMATQHRKQKAFLSAAFGSPVAWKGKDMRRAHEDMTLTEVHFNAVAENLQKTLEEMKVPQPLISEVMTIAASTKDAVLNRKPVGK
jgi:hemoglobin